MSGSLRGSFFRKVFVLVMRAGDRGMKYLGPVLVCVAVGLVLGISGAYFAVLAPAVMEVFSLTWFLVSGIGLWLLFNVLFNYLSCIFTPPGSPSAPLTEDALRRAHAHRDGQAPRPGAGEGFSLWCKKCDAPKPLRAHHCHVCKKCVLGMDHHCPWVANCVGHYNYKYFFLFLFYMFSICVFGACVTAGPFFGLIQRVAKASNRAVALGPTNDFLSHDWETRKRSWVVFTFVITVSVGLAVLALLLWHVYLVLSAQTTIEYYANRMKANRMRAKGQIWRNPFDQGWRRNWENVFGEGSLYFGWMLPTTTLAAGDGTLPPSRRQRPKAKEATYVELCTEQGGESTSSSSLSSTSRDGEASEVASRV